MPHGALLQAEAAKRSGAARSSAGRDRHSPRLSVGAEIGLLPKWTAVLAWTSFRGSEIRLSSDYSPVLAKALIERHT